MLDLHCHILAGVDDGASDLDTSVEMARHLVAAGYTAVAPSPHYGAGPGGDITADKAASARTALSARLVDEGIALEVLPNAEHHVTPELFERLSADEGIPIGGASKWLLVELPWQPLSDPEGVLFRLQTQGHRLLLAHPERYDYLELDVIARLAERGVKMQLELGSFINMFGQRANFKALAMADRGQAHVLGTDMHDSEGGELWLPQALRMVADRYGKRAVAIGTDVAPRAMVSDAAPDDVSAFTVAR